MKFDFLVFMDNPSLIILKNNFKYLMNTVWSSGLRTSVKNVKAIVY